VPATASATRGGVPSSAESHRAAVEGMRAQGERSGGWIAVGRPYMAGKVRSLQVVLGRHAEFAGEIPAERDGAVVEGRDRADEWDPSGSGTRPRHSVCASSELPIRPHRSGATEVQSLSTLESQTDGSRATEVDGARGGRLGSAEWKWVLGRNVGRSAHEVLYSFLFYSLSSFLYFLVQFDLQF
jgi:hypothetical protein